VHASEPGAMRVLPFATRWFRLVGDDVLLAPLQASAPHEEMEKHLDTFGELDLNPAMNKLTLIFTFLAIWIMAGAQETRTEVTKATTALDDSKANSPQVPEAYAMSGQFERVVVVRVKYQADLLAGIESIVKKEKIRNGVILSGVGSLRGYHIHTVSNRTFPSKNTFVRDPTAPADLVGMNGYIIDGKIHAHVTLATPDKAFGGHLEPGNEVFTFAVITIGVLNDKTDLSRLDDKTWR